MSRKKQYTITYRKRRDKDAKLLYLTIEGLNIDDVKRKFWDKYQKYDMYANPIFTLTKIRLDNSK